MISITQTKDYKLIAALNEEIQTLHVQLHPERFKPYDKTAMELAFEDFLPKPAHHCFIARQDNMAIGYVLFIVREIPGNAFIYSSTILYVDQICVLSTYRKTGVGSMLLRRGEALARELGIRQLILDHWSVNTIAASYFRKQGYVLQREQLGKVVG